MKPQVLSNLSYGIYAIGTKDAKRPNACIVNTVMQISKATPSDAPLVALSMNRENYSCECIEKSGVFSISVLSEATPATVIGALGLVSGTDCIFGRGCGRQRRIGGNTYDLSLLCGKTGRRLPEKIAHLSSAGADFRQEQRGKLCLFGVRLCIQRPEFWV